MEEKEMRQLEFPPEFGEKKEETEEPKSKSKPKSTLKVTGHRGDYLPGVKQGEKIRWKMMNRVRIQLAKILGREVTYQPELEGLEERKEEKKE